MKIAAWIILQFFGAVLMLCGFLTAVSIIYNMVLTSRIEIVIEDILLAVVFIFVTIYLGSRLFKKGGNIIESIENIEESDNSELNEMEQTEVDEDDKILIDHLSQKEVAVTSPPRVVSCKGCGANNIIESDKAQCEYCGGYLT